MEGHNTYFLVLKGHASFRAFAPKTRSGLHSWHCPLIVSAQNPFLLETDDDHVMDKADEPGGSREVVVPPRAEISGPGFLSWLSGEMPGSSQGQASCRGSALSYPVAS